MSPTSQVGATPLGLTRGRLYMSNQSDDFDRKHVAAVPSRREALIAGASLVAASFLRELAATAQSAQAAKAAQPAGRATAWVSYGGDKASSKYSPLAQIGPDNFSRLRVAWTWRSTEEKVVNANPQLRTWVWEATPLMVDGVLYVATSLSQVAAIDAATGKTRFRSRTRPRRGQPGTATAGSRAHSRSRW